MIFFRKEPKTIQNSKGLLVLLPLVVLLGMMGCTQAKNENSPNENSAKESSANVVLRVAILGDAEPKPKPEFPGLSSAVDRINALAAHAPIHFTIGVGDIAHKATDIQYENATPHLQRLTMPFYPIMGNEEHHGSVQKFLKYANLWGNGKTSFDSPRYVLETPQVGFVFASPDFGRDFNDTGVVWINEQVKKMHSKPVVLIVHGAQIGVYPEREDKGIANPTFESVIANKNLVAVVSGDLHMDMPRVNHSKKIDHVHYLHIPALERTKIPDETNHTPMIRVLTIHSDGLVVVNTYEVGVNEAPIAKYEYGFTIDSSLWNGVPPAKEPMQLESRNRSDNICSTATRIDSVTVQLGKDFSKQKAKASADLVNTLIEIPTGTLEKWELNKNNPKQIIWERKNEVLRQVQYLGYPGNYGAIPSTNMALEQGGDGDALDVLVLGAALARGSWHTVRPIGILYMQDDGEQDDKIIAVDPNSPPFGAVQSLKELDSLFAGSTTIISTWFKHYKGPQTSVQIKGMGGSTQAWEVINARLMASNNKEI